MLIGQTGLQSFLDHEQLTWAPGRAVNPPGQIRTEENLEIPVHADSPESSACITLT